jgi:lysophospholipase L1-like esterase
LFGDSITAGFPVERLLSEYNIINSGGIAETTESALERIENEVVAIKPAAVFVLLGVNDLVALFSNDMILVNYERIIIRLMKGLRDIPLFIQSIIPTRNHEHAPIERIQLLNIELHKLALRYGVKFLDIYPLFLDKQGELSVQYSEDGIHLNETGYREWANYLKQIFSTLP